MKHLNLFLILVLAGVLHTPGLEARPSPEAQESSTCLGCHGNLRGRNAVQPERYAKSVHGDLSCLTCHSAARVAAIDSVHRRSAPSSGEHLPPPPGPLARKSPFADALASCATCHEKVFRAVRRSIHGVAVFERRNTDAAFCTDCHRPIHSIRPPSAVSSSVARSNLVATCSRCHDNKIISSKYNLNLYVVRSYKDHFHGKKYDLGDKTAPTCIFCHGHHRIQDVRDPAAPVSSRNKVALCARCHPGATAAFAASFTHTPLLSEKNRLAFHIRKALVIILIVTVLLLSIHILLDLARDIRSLGRRKKAAPARAKVPWSLYQRLPREVERMDLHLRIQHAILFVAVFYLAASGIALKFPGIRFSQSWIRLWGGIENAGHLHRFGALVLMADAFYHLLYVVIRGVRRKLTFQMVPTLQDFRDLFQNIHYLSGLNDEPPRFGKYSYFQKLDYWLVVFVVSVMIVTGLMYWFPTVTARVLPAGSAVWVWGVAYVIHSTEALLIIFFAFVWHFYNVHLKSRVFPMNWVWITGKISLEDVREEHPAEFDGLVEAEKQKIRNNPESEQDESGRNML